MHHLKAPISSPHPASELRKPSESDVKSLESGPLSEKW